MFSVFESQQQVYATGRRGYQPSRPRRGNGSELPQSATYLGAAAQIDAVNSLGDFDNEPVVLLRDAEVTLPDGEVVT